MNTRSLGTSCIKETEESLPRVDFSVPVMHHAPSVLGLICLIRKRQILLDFTIQPWISSKKEPLIFNTSPKCNHYHYHFFLCSYNRYGDRSPRSLLARMYAAVWMIIGMVTLSTFTADVSSVLTAREMMPQNSYLNRIVTTLTIY